MITFHSKFQRFVWVLVVAGTTLATVKYASLSPYDRCLTATCRELAGEEENRELRAKWAPIMEAADRDVERADREMEKIDRKIDDINRAISSFCALHPETCRAK